MASKHELIRARIFKLGELHAMLIAAADRRERLADKREIWAHAQWIEDQIAGERRRIRRARQRKIERNPAYTLFPTEPGEARNVTRRGTASRQST